MTTMKRRDFLMTAAAGGAVFAANPVLAQQGDTPATFKAVITWRDRNIDREAPGGGTFIRIRYNH